MKKKERQRELPVLISEVLKDSTVNTVRTLGAKSFTEGEIVKRDHISTKAIQNQFWNSIGDTKNK